MSQLPFVTQLCEVVYIRDHELLQMCTAVVERCRSEPGSTCEKLPPGNLSLDELDRGLCGSEPTELIPASTHASVLTDQYVKSEK